MLDTQIVAILRLLIELWHEKRPNEEKTMFVYMQSPPAVHRIRLPDEHLELLP